MGEAEMEPLLEIEAEQESQLQSFETIADTQPKDAETVRAEEAKAEAKLEAEPEGSEVSEPPLKEG